MNEPDPNPPTGTKSKAIGDTAKQAWESTKEKAGDALHTGERYIRENPGTSVLGIFGLGLVVGLLAGWSMAHEAHDSYAASARKWAKRLGQKLDID